MGLLSKYIIVKIPLKYKVINPSNQMIVPIHSSLWRLLQIYFWMFPLHNSPQLLSFFPSFLSLYCSHQLSYFFLTPFSPSPAYGCFHSRCIWLPSFLCRSTTLRWSFSVALIPRVALCFLLINFGFPLQTTSLWNSFFQLPPPSCWEALSDEVGDLWS